MKTTIGGDRLGSGNKQQVSMRNYERSTHDLGYLWRSSMSAGTLVPFMSKLALPGDSFDINLNCECLTLPTIGPLFGSYKIQLDVFEVPMRLYNANLHMNKLGIGMDMSNMFIPQLQIRTNNHADYVQTHDDNEHINPSCLLKYLGMSGLGHVTGLANPAIRYINAIPLLAYWDIYKNYYSNKQEEIGYYIHTTAESISNSLKPISATLYDKDLDNLGSILGVTKTMPAECSIRIQYPENAPEIIIEKIQVILDTVVQNLDEVFTDIYYNPQTKEVSAKSQIQTGELEVQNIEAKASADTTYKSSISLQSFDLDQIDIMRENILKHTGASYFQIDNVTDEPYNCFAQTINTGANERYAMQFSQEGLGIKTYQSDLFNNWIQTEWIDGEYGVNEISAVSTIGDSFTIDSLNLAQKVYVMLNRIAISGGTYDDWLDAVYTHERVKGVESPVYHGSLIKELAFEEVISNSASGDEPLGTLAGRGRLTGKHKGGKMNIKVNEPSYIIGIASITPRIEYSQGNSWDMNLKTFNDFHKPALDAIGFQDLITDQIAWQDTQVAADTGALTFKSLGKQPAWINYMTDVNRVYGNFADTNKEMFMTLNRRYEVNPSTGALQDGTTYIDPAKFNHIFADTNLDSQNFWMQIAVNIIARRKMSAKVIPNL